MSDYAKYLEAARVYERLRDARPDLVRHMKSLIDEYAESRDEISGRSAGRQLIQKCGGFQAFCGDKSSQVFGILLRDHLTAGEWRRDEEDGESAVYQRV